VSAFEKSNPTLITFPPSLDCELARFLLAHYGVRHSEEPHAFIFSFFVTLWHAHTVIFPVLYGDSVALVGPWAIAEFFDRRCAKNLCLIPNTTRERRQLASDWLLFSQTLAFATARFAYYHLLPHRDIMTRPLSLGAPSYESRIVAAGYPIFSAALSRLLSLSEEKSLDSLEQVRTVFNWVDIRLSFSKGYLVGDRLSLSDISFAVAAAPVVMPAEYGGAIPNLGEMPLAMKAVIKEMREHPAGHFALRIYAQCRGHQPS